MHDKYKQFMKEGFMEDKKGHMDMSPEEYDAKMRILEELRELARELMQGKIGDKMGQMKEVSVAAPDEESLKEGLDLAQNIVEEGGPSESMMEEEDEDDEEELY